MNPRSLGLAIAWALLSTGLASAQVPFPLHPVPYNGAALAITYMIGDNILVGRMIFPLVVPHHHWGEPKISSIFPAKRSPLAPEISTVDEQGVRGYEATLWSDVTLLKERPKPVNDCLQAQIGRVVRSPEMRESLIKAGYEPFTLAAPQLEKAVSSDGRIGLRHLWKNNSTVLTKSP